MKKQSIILLIALTLPAISVAARTPTIELADIKISGTPFGGSLKVGLAPNGDVKSFMFSSPWPGTARVNQPISQMIQGKVLRINGRGGKQLGKAALRNDLHFNPSVGGTFTLSFLNCQKKYIPISVKLERDATTNRWSGKLNGKTIRTVLLDGPVISKSCLTGVRVR